jgi:ubiquinol-cytochrome c reductase cytochrome c1 subunit
MTTMRNALKLLLVAHVVALTAALAGAAAASGPDVRIEPAPINRLDLASQQRGARTFVNYCLNCHTAKYMRYNRLADLGLTEAQIRDNLMFATDKIGDTMTIAMRPADAKAWFNVVPPDLTVEARVRGADWLYNYFLAFYKDDATPSGWNNLLFPNVAMPHVLGELSGTNRLVTTEFEDHEKAQAAALAAVGIVQLAPGKDHKYVVRTLVQESPGTVSAIEYQHVVADLVNFLDYMGEPAKNQRTRLGLVVLLYLGVLFVFAYWMKREYWKDVH